MSIIQQFEALIAAVRAGNYPVALALLYQILIAISTGPTPPVPIPSPPHAKAKFAALHQWSADTDFIINEIESHVLTAQGDVGKLPWDQLTPLLMALLLKLFGLS